MELELKHLAPYLSYGLKGMHITREIMYVNSLYYPPYDNNEFRTKCPIQGCGIGGYMNSKLEDFKPILRPLSDLTKEIEINGEIIVPYYWFEVLGFVKSASLGFNSIKFQFDPYYSVFICERQNGIKYNLEEEQERINQLPYNIIQKLLECQFDIFGLIEKGLAIDLNSENFKKFLKNEIRN